MSIVVNKQIIANANGDMNTSIYDPQNKQTDIYSYVDERDFVISVKNISAGLGYENRMSNRVIAPENLTLTAVFEAIENNKNIMLHFDGALVNEFSIDNILYIDYYSSNNYMNTNSSGIKFSNANFEAEMVTNGFISVWRKKEPLYELPEIDEVPDGVLVIENAITATAIMSDTITAENFVIEFIDDGEEGETLPSTMITYKESFVSDALDGLDERILAAETSLNNLDKPNWKENDPNSASYILNRPFYEDTSANGADVAISSWTGECPVVSMQYIPGITDGLTGVSNPGIGCFTYGTMNATISEPLVPGVYKIIVNDDAIYSVELNEYTGGTNGLHGENNYDIQIEIQAGIENNISIDLTLGHSGQMSAKYDPITSLQILKFDDSITSYIKKIDQKFLPDTLATKEYVDNLILGSIRGYY